MRDEGKEIRLRYDCLNSLKFYFLLLTFHPSSLILPVSRRHQFSRTQPRPLAHVCCKALTADYIPLHLNEFIPLPDVDVDCRFYSLKTGRIGEMRLLVLMFYGVIRGAAIDVMAVYTNAHLRFLQQVQRLN